MLPDHEIAARLHDGTLTITPEPDLTRLQPASVDITLGEDFRHYRPPRWPQRIVTLDSIPADLAEPQRTNPDGVVLAPGDFVLASTAEHFRIPDDLCAFLHGRSTLGRLGIACHVTAGLIDPGFAGSVTLEITNLGPLTVHLRPGDPVGQITFTQLDSPAARPYGSDGLASRYQGQSGPTPPRRAVGDGTGARIVELRPGAS